MALKYTVANLDDVPEALRSEYAEHTAADGSKSYRLALELPDNHSIEDVRGLKSSLTKERDNNKAAAKLIKELEARLATAPEPALTAEVETLRATIRDSEVRLQAAVADAEISKAVVKHKGNAELLPTIVKTMTRVEDGKVLVLGADNKVRDGVTVDDLIAELAADNKYAGLFAGTGRSGGGSTGTDGGKGGHVQIAAGMRRSSMKPSDKAKFIREHGQERYMQIPW